MDVVLEVHWSNSPIPISKLAECPDHVFDLHVGGIMYLPMQDSNVIILNPPQW